MRARKAAEAEEQRRFDELEKQLAEKRALNIKIREEAQARELSQRRERERRIMEEAQALRHEERHSALKAEQAEAELQRQQEKLYNMQQVLDERREQNISLRGY